MKILLTADWQVDFSNLSFSAIAHKQELAIIEKERIDIHIDLGDAKDTYNPVDMRVVDFMLARAKAIQERVKTSIRIMGNHDRYGQSNDANNWMSMFDLVGGHNVSEPTVVQDAAKIDFFCLPFRKDAEGTISAAIDLFKRSKKSIKRKVLLFHNDVCGTKYDNVQNRLSTSHITLEKMFASKYDFCFGGHVHKRQMLSKNAMYVGNPFATDMGEINQKKGFIIYDDETNTTSFIASKVPGLYSWSYAKSHFKTVPEGTRIKEVVHCSVKEDYHKRLNTICDAIEKKFPLSIAYVLPKFITKDTQEEIIVDPNSSDYEKIKSYVKAAAPKDFDRTTMVEYLASVLATVEGRGISRHTGKIIFDEIRAKNVLTFETLKFNYRNRGVMLVKGHNKDVTKFNSIGSGKTNFLSMPSIALFGQTFKQQKNDAWASDLNETAATVRLKMHNDIGSNVEIIRSRRPGKLRMLVNDKDESTGLRNNTKKATQGQLEQFIGYTFDTFYKSVYIDQSLSNAFLNGTNKDRSNLIHQFQNLERFSVARQIVSKEMSALAQRQHDVETELEITSKHLSELSEDIHARAVTQTQSIKTLKTKYLHAKKLLSSHIKESKKRLRQYSARVDKLQKEKTRNQRLESTSEAIIVQGSRAIDALNVEIKAVKNLEHCDVCKRPVGQKQRYNITASLFRKITKIEIQSNSAERDLKIHRANFTEIRRALLYLDEKVNVIDANTDKLERLVEKSKAAYNAVKDTSTVEHESIKVSRSKYDTAKQALKNTKKTLKNYEDDRKFLDFALNAFSRDGLQSFLSNLVIPVLNQAAERYSKLFIDREIQVVFDLDKGQIVPRIINAHGGKSLQAQSTGEKAWAGIITSFSLREISHPTNLLILDEPGHGLDSESAKTFGKNLLKLKSLFETVLVVTHDPSISSALEGENTVTITKHNKISTLN